MVSCNNACMLNALILQLEVVIREYGAMGVFFAALLEEIIAPIPSSLVAMFAGFFLVPAELTWLQAIVVTFFKVAIPMSIGVTGGSLIVYTIAYFGGKPIIARYGKWFGVSWASIEQAEQKFTKGYADELTLLGARALPIIPSVAISVFCGLVRYPIKTFILFTLMGTFIRSTIMAMIGWQVRDAYIAYAGIINQIEKFIFVAIIIACAAFLFLRLWQKIKKKKAFIKGT